MQLFSSFGNSIANPPYYKNLKALSKGKAIGYAFFLAFLMTASAAVINYYEKNGFKNFVESFKKEAPDFVLEKGELKVEGKQPLRFDTEEGPVIIDTTGQTPVTALDDLDSGVLILKDQFIHKRNKFKTEHVNLKEIPIRVDKQAVIGWFPSLYALITFFSYFAHVFYVFFAALLVSLTGLLIKLFKKAPLSFGDLYKLSIYTLTTSFLVWLVLRFFSIHIPLVVWILISTFILAKAIQVISEDNPPRSEDPALSP